MTEIVTQKLYDSKYGIEEIFWNEALAKYYHAVAISENRRYVLYLGNSNVHAVVDRGDNVVYEEFGYHAWNKFASLSGMNIKLVNEIVDLYYLGGNDIAFWKDSWVQATYVGKHRTFYNDKKEQMIVSPGDLVLGYISHENYFYCLSLGGIRLRDLRDIRMVSKATVTEFNLRCGYQWDDSYQHFVRIKS